MSVAAPQLLSSDNSSSRVRKALNQSGYTALRNVQVFTTNDGICLAGIVQTYYLKQLAQSLAMDIVGIGNVLNEITVE